MQNNNTKQETSQGKKLREIEDEMKHELSLVPMHISTLMKKEFPDTEWVVEKLVPADAITGLSGAPSSFKTWLILEIIYRVAKGIALFDRFATGQGAVLVVDEENGERLLQKRLKVLCKNYDELPIYILSINDVKVTNDTVELLLKFCKEKKIKLIVFDSLVRIHSGNENEASEMAKVFAQFKKFCKQGTAVLFTHHNRKQGAIKSSPADAMRGSSDILAAVDCHIAISRGEENDATLTQTKLRHDKEANPFRLIFTIDDNSFHVEYVGEVDVKKTRKLAFKDAIHAVLTDAEEPMIQKDLFDAIKAEGVEGGKTTFKDAVKEMFEEGELFQRKGKGNTTLYSLKPFEDNAENS